MLSVVLILTLFLKLVIHLQRRIENASLAIALLCLIAALIMLAIVIS